MGRIKVVKNIILHIRQRCESFDALLLHDKEAANMYPSGAGTTKRYLIMRVL